MGRLGQYRLHNHLWQGATSHSVWPPVLCQDAGGGLAYQWGVPWEVSGLGLRSFVSPPSGPCRSCLTNYLTQFVRGEQK